MIKALKNCAQRFNVSNFCQKLPILNDIIKKYILFIIVGALTCTFVSPLNWWLFLFFGLIFFAKYTLNDSNLVDQEFKSAKQYRRLKFFQGWLFGYGYYLFLFHWIATPLFIGGIGKYYLLLPFAWIVVPALLGLHFGLTAYAAAYVSSFSESKYIKSIVAGLVWGFLEYIRLQIIPFYPMSFVMLNSFVLSQIFYYIHPVILSWIIFQIIVGPFFALINKKENISVLSEIKNMFLIPLIVLIIIVLEDFFPVSKNFQVNKTQQKITTKKVITNKVIIIQPNISQSVKNNADYIDSEIQKLYEQTKDIALKYKDALIIWPEASIPFRVDLPFFYNYSASDLASLQLEILRSEINGRADDFYVLPMQYNKSNYSKLVKRLIFRNRMIVGLEADFIKALFSNSSENGPNNSKNNSFTGGILMGINTFDIMDNQVYTSTALFTKKTDNTQSTIQQIYDKINLIPFGEYVPMRNWLPNLSFIKAMAATIGDYKAGKSSPIHYWRGKRLAVLICYEGLFDIPYTSLDCEQGVDKCQLDAIIHISNDGWFGNSFCLYQDLDHARVKAIQYNCKVLRCLNTGISAEIDRYGRVLKSLPVEKSGILEADL